MKTLHICIGSIALSLLLFLLSLRSYGQGASSSDPIVVDLCSNAGYYNDYRDTREGIFQNEGQVWYRFELGTSTTVMLSTCSPYVGDTGKDTYIELYSYNGSLNQIASNDDGGPDCNSAQASLRMALDAGVYYLKCQSYGDNRGEISTSIICTIPQSTGLIGATYSNPVNLGIIGGAPIGDERSMFACYGNLLGENGKDICYKFTLSTSLSVDFSTFQSDLYHVNLYLLDANRHEITSVTGSGRNSMNVQLASGSYFLVIESGSYQQDDYSSLIRLSVKADLPGALFGKPINVGSMTTGSSYSDIRNNGTSYGYGNEMGQPSDDIFYKFTLNTSTAATVTISHCGSNVDSYIHLLDVGGNVIATNDNYGPVCASLQASIKQLLSPGVYYVVSEGAGSSSGNINTQISVSAGAGWSTNLQNYVRTRTPRKAMTSIAELEAASENRELVQVSTDYIDGLGRVVQTVQRQASPLGSDLVQQTVYDHEGRSLRTYLPYRSTDTNGNFKTGNPESLVKAFYNPASSGISGVALTNYPYMESIIEKSSLTRQTEQSFPGEHWQPYSTSVTGSGHTVKTNYSTNAWGEVNIWVLNESGAAINGSYSANELSKVITTDENGNKSIEFKDSEERVLLKQVESGSGVFQSTYYLYDDLGNLRYVLPPAVSVVAFNESDEVFKHYIYAYLYDNQNRLIKKIIPGKSVEYYVYNKLNRVVLTQNGLQRSRGIWMFTKYDAHGRVTITGECIGYSSQEQAQQMCDTFGSAYWDTFTGTGTEGYDMASFPTGYSKILRINYYDNYDIPGREPDLHTPTIQGINLNPKGLLTGSKVNILGQSNYLLSVTFYDDYGRPVQISSRNHMNASDLKVNVYDFMGEVTTSQRTHENLQYTLSLANRYVYDHMGRKKEVYQLTKNAGGVQPEVLLSSSSYNEIGQLHTKSLCNGLQTNSYSYHPRGWLKGVSSPQFSYELKYEDGSVAQYNGNISNQLWGNGNLNHSFAYSYDKQNRMLAGSSPGLSESISYDVMGNIKTLNRDGYGGTNVYSYSGNKLSSMQGFINGSYNYDEDGNLISDGPRGIQFSYNNLGLTQSVSGNTHISYLYDGDGVKLRKQSGVGTIDYVNGIHYLNGAVDFIQTEEGIVRRNGNDYSYEYNLKDHLGNVRYTFYCNPVTKEIERLQSDNYYPFGMRKSESPVSLNNKYLYNGKELQEELNQYDYGARFYDPVVGRFNTVDNSAEDYEEYSPYVYVGNNPISRVDPDGNDWGDIVKGVFVAVVDNATGGVSSRRMSYNNAADYNRGQDIGDGLSILAGGLEAIVGGGTAAGGVGVTISTGGVGGVAGAPAVAEGTAMMGHGVMMGSKGASNLANQKGRVFDGQQSTENRSSREAHRTAKDQNGVPRSQQPIKP